MSRFISTFCIRKTVYVKTCKRGFNHCEFAYCTCCNFASALKARGSKPSVIDGGRLNPTRIRR